MSPHVSHVPLLGQGGVEGTTDPNRLVHQYKQLEEDPGTFMLDMYRDTIRRNHQEPHSQRSRANVVSDIVSSIKQARLAGNLYLDDLLRTDFMSVVLNIILDGHFCGFSKDELLCWSTNLTDYLENVKPYVVWTITLFTVCLDAAISVWESSFPASSAQYRELSVVFHSLLRASSKFWDALWEIRTPFLDSQPVPSEATHSPVDMVDQIITDFATLSWFIERRLGPSWPATIRAPSCRIAHVMVACWIWGSQEVRRHTALEQAMIMAGDRCQSPAHGSGYTKIFQNELQVAGCTGPMQVAGAILRDYRGEFRGVNQMLHALLWALTVLRPDKKSPMTSSPDVERALLMGALAAARTQACVVNVTDNGWELGMDLLCFFITNLQNDVSMLS
ncbi:uncharacterized protein PHACADRAFT_200916 [Phanerochaete carnosa HHB-10118-sp]|uniref:Uncharacterized protein n=1 Tax=Phanerochaete carnosa (strain HHB-10118-sp) TaxID=650164 RepID=K5VTE6_PHACS|nr:uncharacterized protein PHACADRAFT_200916 [Phanerochaete carnosa HHB-10118-sp]EKM50070.1 hypothetical protein PHACADRAFT_200916 [Phanerochaete carnosa HHB-10118-sp]